MVGTRKHFWWVPATKELPTIETVLKEGKINPVCAAVRDTSDSR